ncbi:hypothetical protein CK203_052948 [Vitis vinifera]|uniref:Uncharacterized protein n=1 Tax=Vitis vinifera TaxID=29760 RepID=A0A438GT17_VITVI|nr:hypothetical protein CK203_052948 [Vitis vinifera]
MSVASPERGPNFSSWVRFSGKGLALLVEGGETWSAVKAGERFRNAWGEGERRYLLDLRSNRAGRFLFCLAWDVEGKKFLKEGGPPPNAHVATPQSIPPWDTWHINSLSGFS